MLDVKEKQVLVFGSGISGTAAVRLLEKEGAQVILYDGNEKLDLEKVKEQLGEGSRARIVLGAFPEELLETLDLLILSPRCPHRPSGGGSHSFQRDPGDGRGGACLFLWKRRCAGDHRDQRKELQRQRCLVRS